MGVSIVQEYYKVQELWANIESNKNWKLAIWLVDFEDAEIVSSFMGIEASPLGKFNDIFFHFTSEYKGDDIEFERNIFNEYISWFEKSQKQEEDILEALKNDKLLLSEYLPNILLKPTFENLWKEMLRFKSCIKGLEKDYFCAYFQIPATGAEKSTSLYKDIISGDIPDGIRIVAIDYKQKRKIKIRQSSKVVFLEPKLEMTEALQSEINKGAFTTNTVGVEGRYRKLVLSILTKSQHGKSAKLDKEIEQLFTVSKEMGDISTIIGSYLIAAQAYFYVNNEDKCEFFSEKTIFESEKMMNDGNTNLYPIWRGASMLKAAIYIGQQKRNKAIEIYTRLAEEATKRADAFFIMESYRLVGHLYYELGSLNYAFENTILALAGGSYLEKNVIRQSTFLQAANLSLYLAERTRGYDSVKVIEEQLKEWIGEDWEPLVKNETIGNAIIRHKASFLDRITTN